MDPQIDPQVLAVGIATLISLAGSVIIGISCLFLRGKIRTHAITVLLTFGTFTTTICLASSQLPALQKLSNQVTELEYVRQADLVGANLKECACYKKIDPTLKTVLDWFGISTSQTKALAELTEFLHDLDKQHPDDTALKSRLAIATHESGRDAEPFLTRQSSKLPLALAHVYRRNYSQISYDTATIATALPDGWYKDAALLSAYREKAPEQFQSLLQQAEKPCRNWINKVLTFVVLKTALFACGILALIYMARSKNQQLPAWNKQPFGIKTVYGCFLAIVQGVILSSLFLTAAEPENQSTKLIFMDSWGVFSILISTLLSLYFFAYRPHGLRFYESAGLSKSPYYTWLQTLGLSFCTFCILIAISPLTNIVSRLLPQSDGSIFSKLIGHLYDAIISGNAVLIFVSTLSVCIIAPISEEILFRGFLYRWLRGRWSVTASALVSAAFFALVHCSVQSFFPILVIGIFLAVLYERTRSIIPGMITHCLWNSWTLLQLFLLAF